MPPRARRRIGGQRRLDELAGAPGVAGGCALDLPAGRSRDRASVEHDDRARCDAGGVEDGSSNVASGGLEVVVPADLDGDHHMAVLTRWVEGHRTTGPGSRPGGGPLQVVRQVVLPGYDDQVL